MLRVGSKRVERWSPGGEGWLLESSVALGAGPAWHERAGALSAAVRECLGTGLRPCSVDLVVESAWMPALHVLTGRSLVTREQIAALVRHRFERQFRHALGPVGEWEVMTNHRAGDPHCLAYGLPPAVRRSFTTAAGASGRAWRSIQPAQSWFAQSQEPDAILPRGTGWWVLLEQDRSLVARVEGKKVVSMNPAGPVPRDPQEAHHAVTIEAFRRGVAAPKGPQEIVVGSWERPLIGSSLLAWHSVARPPVAGGEESEPDFVQAGSAA